MLSTILSVLLLSTLYGVISDTIGTKTFETELRKYLDESQCFQNCIKASALKGIARHAKNRGLHSESTPDSCGVMLIEHLPSGLYVDIDQVAGLAALGGPKLVHFDFMDVEKPAHLSDSHIILVFDSLSPSAKNSSMWSAELHLPIHIRYHSPNEGGIPVEVTLPSPTVLFSCSSGQIRYKMFDFINCSTICGGDSQFEAPCWWSESSRSCNWQLLPFQVSEPLVFHVPVGNTMNWTLVANMTIIITIICCISICWALWQTKNGAVGSKLHRH